MTRVLVDSTGDSDMICKTLLELELELGFWLLALAIPVAIGATPIPAVRLITNAIAVNAPLDFTDFRFIFTTPFPCTLDNYLA